MKILLIGVLAMTTIAFGQTIAPPTTLTLHDAEQLALRNNPRIARAHLLALAESQVTRETRAAALPSLTGSLTAVDSHAGSRITAGSLNNPIVYARAAGGVTISQLLTDFGRTSNLVSSANLRAKASASAQAATSADILLAVDETFFRALGTQAVLQVAKDTVAARQTTFDQVNALTSAKLKSTLDLSFANVNLAQAKLLLLNAQNDNREALLSLNALLGNEQDISYSLVDETPAAPTPAPPDAEPL